MGEVDKKAGATPATTSEQGSEVNPNGSDVSNTEEVKENQETIPQWAVELKASNDAVIESNNSVIESNNELIESNDDLVKGLDKFMENSGEIIREMIKIANDPTSATVSETKKAVVVEVKEGARYVVAKGKKFVDKNTETLKEEGHDVSDMETERLSILLQQGVIEEFVEAQED